MMRSATRAPGRGGTRVWLAAALIALACHAVWFIPRSASSPSSPSSPAAPPLFLQALDGSERAWLTPLFFAFDPGRSESPGDEVGIPARPALPALPNDPVAREFSGPVLGAGSTFRDLKVGAGGLEDAWVRTQTPEPPEPRSVRWSFEADPPGSWSATDLRETTLPESPLPGVPEIRARIDFGPEGFPVAVSLDPDSPEIRGVLREPLMRWRLRPELAPGARGLRLRPVRAEEASL